MSSVEGLPAMGSGKPRHLGSRPTGDPPRARAIAFLYGRLDYERLPTIPYQPAHLKLSRMRELLHRLGDPQQQLSIVHVAGSKGKGSASTMIAAMLSAAGYRTGSYTSPHLERVEERIAIDGRACSSDEFVQLVHEVRPAVESMDAECEADPAGQGPTYFEILTALALCSFRARGVDLAVLEVGLGGRLDSTNVCLPLVSVITSISLDHTRQLGDTTAAIAGEKAGIIKSGVPVVSGVADLAAREVIAEAARQRGCVLRSVGRDFAWEYSPPEVAAFDAASHDTPKITHGRVTYRRLPPEGGCPERRTYRIAMLGSHQAANAATALATVDELSAAGYDVSVQARRDGLLAARCPARIEVMARRPWVVLDAAHNGASIAALTETLDAVVRPRRRFVLLATTRGKDAKRMLRRLVPWCDQLTLTCYRENPRSCDPHELARMAERVPCPAASPGENFSESGVSTAEIRVIPDARQAWNSILAAARPDDLICITGSFFLAAELRRTVQEDCRGLCASGAGSS